MNLVELKGTHLPKRAIWMMIAVGLMGVGVSVCVHADLGQDPCSTMNIGIASKIGLSFGMWQAILNTALFIIVFFLDRRLLGIGTIANMLLIGFIADFLKPLWINAFPADLHFALRMLLAFGGVMLMLVGCSIYMTANLGMAPYDCIPFLIMNRTKSKNKKLQYILLRISQDAVCVLIGFLCGATVGIGTIFMVALSGPVIPFFNKHLAAPILGIKDMSKLRTE